MVNTRYEMNMEPTRLKTSPRIDISIKVDRLRLAITYAISHIMLKYLRINLTCIHLGTIFIEA